MAQDPALIGSWELAGDGADGSGHGRHAVARGAVRFERPADGSRPGAVARLAGDGRLEVAGPLVLGRGDLTVAAWVRPASRSTTVLGDVASTFDPATRRGFTLGIEHGAPCGSHGNDRTPWFGVDAGTEPTFTDLGRPGAATIMVCSLAVFEDALYAATWEGGQAPRGRVWRFDDPGWTDCGSPWDANAVSRLAVHDGALYAGVSRLRGGGSGMPDSANRNPGGRILRHEGGDRWADMGQLPEADSITALVPFDGSLYAAPMYSEGLFRMDAPGRWAWCGSPGRRLLALGVHAGALYGAGNDHADVVSAIELTRAGVVVPSRSEAGGGGVFRYEGDERWTSLGLQPGTTQLYSIETWGGRMHVGTWPSGLVFRAAGLEGPGPATWEPWGRLGDETEIMNLQAYNGMLYGGTLPHAQVHRLDGDGRWTWLATLDDTPDVLYRRAASFVLHRGALAIGTLPSGHVHAMRAGTVASPAGSLPSGWRHLAGVRRGGEVTLYVDGAPAAASSTGAPAEPLDLGAAAGLVLGGGPRAGFEGELSAVRLYARALAPDEVAALAG